MTRFPPWKQDVVLRGEFARAWREDEAFAEVGALSGELFRSQQSRRTLRFDFAGASWFLKTHGAVSWGEILKNLAVLKLPVVSARNEWLALARLRELGVDSLSAEAYGRRGLLPARLESFLITRDLGRLASLEDICATWPHQPPSTTLKRALIAKVAGIAARMHGAGMCHRDFYLCHFLQDAEDPTRLYLIDLHRALIRRRLGRRWVVKDLGGLYFSAFDIGLTTHDLLRFVQAYSGKPWRVALEEDGGFWNEVRKRALALKRRHG